MGLKPIVMLLDPGLLFTCSQTYFDLVRVCSYPRNANPAYIFRVRVTVKGLADSVLNLFNVGCLKLGVDYTGEVEDDTRELLLIYLLGRIVDCSWRSTWCYFVALSCNCGL